MAEKPDWTEVKKMADSFARRSVKCQSISIIGMGIAMAFMYKAGRLKTLSDAAEEIAFGMKES